MSTPRGRGRALRAALLVPTLLAGLLAAAVPTAAAPQQSQAAPSTTAAKGTVGWQTYRSLDGLAKLRPGEQTRQFSSTDDKGLNDDGFGGTYSCLRTDSSGCVIAEASGAGEVSSIWFTYAPETVSQIGAITVVLDGKTVLQGSLQDIVNGAKGAPFVWPLVGNSADTMGGTVIKVPMPYTQSMKITTQNNPHFYHVDYRQFADASGVSTFNPADQAQDVIDRLRGFGVRDPKPAASGATTQTAAVNLAAGASMALPLTGGARQVSQLQLRLPQTVTSPAVQDDGRAFGAGGSSTFRAAIASNNQGVRVTRRLDPHINNQRGSLSVDGAKVGEWNSGAGTGPYTWGDQAIEVPAANTAGKSSLTLTNAFISSSLDFNEFRYDVHSKINGQWVRTDVLDLGPNNPHDEAVHGYQIKVPTWSGLGVFRYPVSAAAEAQNDAILGGLSVRVTFDGKTTVDSPVGEFFGTGLGKFAVRNLMSSVDTTANGAYTSWWPMPYASTATVELVNKSNVAISGGGLEVTSAANSAAATGLAANGSLGYFHATYRRGNTVNGQEWNFLTAQGKGIFYGVSASMRGGIAPGTNQKLFLEGDERVYVDGAQGPSVIGTGSEDFYESGWYFMDKEANSREGVSYAMPQAGLISQENAADGCQYVCLNAYRLMLADGVPFGNGLQFDIEHGPDSDVPANYSSTAYWYGQDSASLAQTDVVDAGNDASRAAHNYTAVGEARGTLKSTFEGKGDTTPVTLPVTSSTGPASFTAKVDQANSGVRLRRTSDQAGGFRRAKVFVDNVAVGEWYEPLLNSSSRWLDDAFDIPASATAGKSSIQVRIEPVTGGPTWSVAKYTVLSQGAQQ